MGNENKTYNIVQMIYYYSYVDLIPFAKTSIHFFLLSPPWVHPLQPL